MKSDKLFNYSALSAVTPTDLVCFCHLRWDFVFQRPQHLMTRFGKNFRVFFIEEPVFGAEYNHYEIKNPAQQVWVVVPRLKDGLSHEEFVSYQEEIVSRLFRDKEINKYLFWYYTPMALEFSKYFKPQAVIYDCMDELSNFKNAPASLRQLEKDLFQKADIVFTGGHSLFGAKKDLHQNIHPFPSSIDKEHFARARKIKKDVDDQAGIPHPRFGFYGVVDERFDLNLIKTVAEKKPNWHFVIVGPVVKIDPASLPQHSNIHYMGGRSYDELPEYLAGWDIAFIPFELNDSTKYISPTKTPEYLAAGKPVISTSITDVVSPYGDNGLVYIADTPEDFIRFGELELKTADRSKWLKKTDEFLLDDSWDNTWSKMMGHIGRHLSSKTPHSFTQKTTSAYV